MKYIGTSPKATDRCHWNGTQVALCLVVVLTLALAESCAFSSGQRYRNFTTTTPLPPQRTLILGFLGGWESWDNEKKGVRRLALKLRSMNLPAAVETVENKKRHLALELIRKALDRNGDSRLEPAEKSAARLILYGQSFGGAAVVKLARQLEELEIPVLLTVQVDSVGRGDALIPPNVRRAANLYQRNGFFIRGEPRIRAEDPTRTIILGNFGFDYGKKKVDLSSAGWLKRFFRSAHTKMDADPEVWSKVEQLILDSLHNKAVHGNNRSIANEANKQHVYGVRQLAAAFP